MTFVFRKNVKTRTKTGYRMIIFSGKCVVSFMCSARAPSLITFSSGPFLPSEKYHLFLTLVLLLLYCYYYHYHYYYYYYFYFYCHYCANSHSSPPPRVCRASFFAAVNHLFMRNNSFSCIIKSESYSMSDYEVFYFFSRILHS